LIINPHHNPFRITCENLGQSPIYRQSAVFIGEVSEFGREKDRRKMEDFGEIVLPMFTQVFRDGET
jgi:hypothetical protein